MYKTIAIDAGHGENIIGQVSWKRHELGQVIEGNDILLAERHHALCYAFTLASFLMDEFRVVLTRKENAFVPLTERARIANSYGVLLTISFHNDDRGIYFFHHQGGDKIASLARDIGDRIGMAKVEELREERLFSKLYAPGIRINWGDMRLAVTRHNLTANRFDNCNAIAQAIKDYANDDVSYGFKGLYRLPHS